ncbi:MAG: Gfo/Idh/MocA family protein [Roseiflexaceae bacterium]|jgi:predicted dehydrogenase
MTRIRLAVVGLNFGSWMIEHELLQGAGAATMQIVAVCDLDAGKVAHWSTQLGVPGFTDIGELLQVVQPQAVALFSGPVGRAALIERIIAHGCDVMTTKPFEGNTSAAEAVLLQARAMGRVVHLNSPAPVMPPDIAQLMHWRDHYQLGEPVAYRATTWCAYREQPDGSWYDDPRLCPVAPMFRLGIYLINDISWFFRGVQTVSVQQARIFTQRPTADNAQLAVAYQNGALGSMFASFCIDDRQYYRCALEMNFAHGTLYRNMGPLAADTTDVQLAVVTVQAERQQIVQATTPAQGAGYQWHEFQRAVQTRASIDDAYVQRIIAGLQILDAMQHAADVP